METGGGHQLGDGARHRVGGGDDRGVRQQPGGRDVLVLREGLPCLPEVAHGGELAPPAHVSQPVGAPPGVLPRRGRGCGAHVLELLEGPVQLPRLGQPVLGGPAQLHEHLHVQGGVVEPVHRQGTLGPVHGRVLLGEREAQQLLGHRGEPHLAQPQQPSAQLGVEEPVRSHVQLREARHVLGGGVQHPLDAAQRLVHLGQGAHGLGVDQDGARSFAAQLHEERALAVAESGGALGVHGHRPRGLGELLGGARQTPRGVHHAGQTLRGAVEVHGRGDGEVLESRDHDLGGTGLTGGSGIVGVSVDEKFLVRWCDGGGTGSAPSGRLGSVSGPGGAHTNATSSWRGGSPAAVQSTWAHACRCDWAQWGIPVRGTGVHEARTSTWATSARSVRLP